MSKKIDCAEDLKKMLVPLEQRMGYKTEFKRIFGQNGDRIILPAYRVMKSQLLRLADGKTAEASKKDKQTVQRASEIMTAITTGGQISQYFRDFAGGYLPLLINWNLQLGKNRSIDTLSKACQRILNDMMTMKDTTDVMNRIAKKLQQMLQYTPPAFELSRHYLKSLQDDIEKREASK